MSTWNWTLLRAGAFRLDGGAMFGIIPRALWQKMSPPDDLHRIHLQTNCLLLERNGQLVLIETGYGNKFDEKSRSMFALETRWIDDALREVNVDRHDIEHVIVTHLHFDHAGGLTYFEDGDETPRPTFPNATVHVQRTEWEDALANKSVMTRTYLREHLDPVADQVNLLVGESDVLDGISVLPAIGHTWGQQAVLVRDSDGHILFPGDVMPTVHHAGPAFNMAYDVLPYENMDTKQRLLQRCVDENIRIVIDHEPGDPLVRVQSDAKRAGRFSLV